MDAFSNLTARLKKLQRRIEGKDGVNVTKASVTAASVATPMTVAPTQVSASPGISDAAVRQILKEGLF